MPLAEDGQCHPLQRLKTREPVAACNRDWPQLGHLSSTGYVDLEVFFRSRGPLACTPSSPRETGGSYAVVFPSAQGGGGLPPFASKLQVLIQILQAINPMIATGLDAGFYGYMQADSGREPIRGRNKVRPDTSTRWATHMMHAGLHPSQPQVLPPPARLNTRGL